jgi:dihydrodipicolinate synthase/N-acetylneuraminate lyase
MRKNKKYHGIVVPMITPVNESGLIDKTAVEKIVQRFVDAEVFPFIIGTTGESSSISEDEKVKFTSIVTDKFKDQTTIYAGVAGNCLSASVDAANKFFDLGVDVVVANLPTYFKLTESQILNYYVKLVESITGPLIVYNITATTHMSIPLSIIDTLSEHPQIVGFKDSERDLYRLKDSVARYKLRDDFSYLIGWAAQSFYGLKIGADGLVPSTANVAPKMFKELYDAVINEDYTLAEQLQKETDELSLIYQKDRILGESLAGLKVMMNEAGLCQSHMLPPLTELNENDKKSVREQMKKFDVR